MARLEGKVAVVTGAATGIGRATAVLFASEGARIVFGDVNDAEAEETVRLIRSAGADATYVHCDVRQGEDVRRLVETAVTAHGRLNVMMNNVGVNFYGKVHETSEEDWAACLNLNLGGVYRGMREAIPHLLAAGGGSIVNTASNQGLVAFNGFAAYAAAKGAIDIPWDIAVGNDLRHPKVQGPRSPKVRFINWYIGKLHMAARHDAELATAFLRVANLEAPPTLLLSPANLLRVIGGNFLWGRQSRSSRKPYGVTTGSISSS